MLSRAVPDEHSETTAEGTAMPSRASTDRFADDSDDEESLLQQEAKKKTAKKSKKSKSSSSSSSSGGGKAPRIKAKNKAACAAGSSSESPRRACVVSRFLHLTVRLSDAANRDSRRYRA